MTALAGSWNAEQTWTRRLHCSCDSVLYFFVHSAHFPGGGHWVVCSAHVGLYGGQHIVCTMHMVGSILWANVHMYVYCMYRQS